MVLFLMQVYFQRNHRCVPSQPRPQRQRIDNTDPFHWNQCICSINSVLLAVLNLCQFPLFLRQNIWSKRSEQAGHPTKRSPKKKTNGRMKKTGHLWTLPEWIQNFWLNVKKFLTGQESGKITNTGQVLPNISTVSVKIVGTFLYLLVPSMLVYTESQ